MEQQLVTLLDQTQSSQEDPRKNAEGQLKSLYANPDFPIGLVNVAAHAEVPINTRQSALLILRTFVQCCWNENLDEFEGPLYTDQAKKAQLRQSILDLVLGGRDERKIKSAASAVVSKIAISDFPDEWPDLLPAVLNVVANGSELQLHGALKVLWELVDDCLSDEHFFRVARDLVKVVYDVAVNEARKPVLRALAVAVFRNSFDTMEMVMEDHKAEIKAFAEDALSGWIPFCLSVLKAPLPTPPREEEDTAENGAAEVYRGWVALKVQVVRCLIRIRNIFPSMLAPKTPELFSATWSELSHLQAQYHTMYIEDDRQGRLEDADGLAYTLDFLVLEELDFMQACLRAPPVRKELEQQLQNAGGVSSSWITELMKIAVAYAHITTEEEGMWDIDVNVFLSEETNVTANYTPRTACGDLLIKLSGWLSAATLEGLLAYTRALYNDNSSWKAKEAVLFLLNQLLSDFQDLEKDIGADAANGYVTFIQHAMQQEDAFLRARGYLVAGSLVRTSGDALQPVAVNFMEASLHAITNDDSEIVKVSCIRALQYYLSSLPSAATLPKQNTIVNALSNFLESQDLTDLADSDDLVFTIIETLRDATMLDTSTCLTNGGIDLLFKIASQGASNFTIEQLVTEIFEDITDSVSKNGPEAYSQLAAKVLPSLMGAFDVANLTAENALSHLAAELLSILADRGSKPMPPGFVATVMPRLNRILLGSSEDDLLTAATSSVQYMLRNDPEQILNYRSEDGKGGLELILVITDRLLGPSVDDYGAANVGGLAAEVVEKAGAERLGPYLPQLLQAVATRLHTAAKAAFIQSLVLVFARLCLNAASDVVAFLAQSQIDGQNGLNVVINKWLENSITFAGYDDIRQNIIALTKIYELHDPRLAEIQVKGDLIVPQSSRIMTRSRAKQQPTQYTTVPAQLKIVKVLVEELLANSNSRALGAGADADEDDDDDDDWEDEPNAFLDLNSGMTKSQLMAYGNDEEGGDFPRERDDETQTYLVQFFQQQGQKPEFAQIFNALRPEEQEKLRNMGNA